MSQSIQVLFGYSVAGLHQRPPPIFNECRDTWSESRPLPKTFWILRQFQKPKNGSGQLFLCKWLTSQEVAVINDPRLRVSPVVLLHTRCSSYLLCISKSPVLRSILIRKAIMARLTATDRPGPVRYRRLANPSQDVRLLEILPARTPEDAIVCRLVTIILDKLDSDFFALSSLPGESDDMTTIYVDGREVSMTSHQAEGLKSMRTVFSSKQKQQRKSWPLSDSGTSQGSKLKVLPQRLRNLLRIPNPCLYIWLDSICVNHNDAEETGQLKETMKRVYRSAKVVAGWLGPAVKETAAGVSVFTDIDASMPRFWGDPGDRDLHPEDYAPTHKFAVPLAHLWKDSDDGTLSFMLPHWVGANDFMGRSYFQRQWILQELFMASNPAFMIGEIIVSWRAILRLNRMLEEFKDNSSDVFPEAYRHMIAELPLGTVYELLEEIMRRKQRLRSVPNLGIEAGNSGIFPYHEYDETNIPESVLKQEKEKASLRAP